MLSLQEVVNPSIRYPSYFTKPFHAYTQVTFILIPHTSYLVPRTSYHIPRTSYFTQPFHAYTQGNLCWDAALEVSMAAKSVHALVMDTEGKKLDPE